MYDAEQRMQEIMEAPQFSVMEKSKLYSNQLNRFLTFKNKLDVPAHYHEAPVQRAPLVSASPLFAELPPQVPPTRVQAEIPPQVSATPKPNYFLIISTNRRGTTKTQVQLFSQLGRIYRFEAPRFGNDDP